MSCASPTSLKYQYGSSQARGGSFSPKIESANPDMLIKLSRPTTGISSEFAGCVHRPAEAKPNLSQLYLSRLSSISLKLPPQVKGVIRHTPLAYTADIQHPLRSPNSERSDLRFEAWKPIFCWKRYLRLISTVERDLWTGLKTGLYGPWHNGLPLRIETQIPRWFLKHASEL